jgi:hypothetical protein
LNNSSKDNDVEILLRFDDDDLDSVAIVKESVRLDLGENGNRKVKYLIGPRYGWPGLYRYYNELATKTDSDCDWLMLFNDDAIMHTKDWDKEIEKYNGQMVIWPCWFTVLPRKVFEIWGYVCLTRNYDTEISDTVDKLENMGCKVRINPPINILHDAVQYVPSDDATFKERDYQSDIYNLKYEFSRRRDAKLLKEYIETGEIKRDNIDDSMVTGDIGTGDVKIDNIGIGSSISSADINKFIESFENKKGSRALYHHDDQINLQKREYELLTKIKPDIVAYPLFKLLCWIVPFKNSVPHIFTLMNLARYSKAGILEIGTCQGEGALALGIGVKMYGEYGKHNVRLTTIDKVQPDNQAKGYFELFKEFLPSDSHIIANDVNNANDTKSLSPIDLLCIEASLTKEDLYMICDKYIPFVMKDGIVIFFNTGMTDVTYTVLKYFNDRNIKYRILSPDPIDNDSRFLYNNIGIGVIRII